MNQINSYQMGSGQPLTSQECIEAFQSSVPAYVVKEVKA